MNLSAWLHCTSCGHTQRRGKIPAAYQGNGIWQTRCPGCGRIDSYIEAPLCQCCEWPVGLCDCKPSLDDMAEQIRGVVAQIKRDFDEITQRLNPLMARKE